MERRRRVYPAQRSKDGVLSWLLLFLTAVVIFSGVVSNGEEPSVSIRRSPTATPIPMDEHFDETPAEKEIELPSATWYSLQLGAFENQESAEKLGERYAMRGAAGYVWKDGRFRTLAAVYPEKEDAQQVREQLRRTHEVETYLYEITLPAIRLRLSGMQGQLEILEAAFLHAHDSIHTLQSLGIAMDRQELGAAEVREKLDGLSNQLQTVKLRLKQRFASPRHETVDGLLKFFDELICFASEVHENESEVVMGTKLKKQTLSSLYLLWQIYEILSNT